MIKKILEVANTVYAEVSNGGQILTEEGTPVWENAGDGLASFIAHELTETNNPKEDRILQIFQAHRAIEKAIYEMQAVAGELIRLAEHEIKINRPEKP